jgi:capsular polysaccharide biosynthesis protein
MRQLCHSCISWRKLDDAPGAIVIGLVIIFASIVIAVFAAVLEKLLRTAIDIKSENDLTI